MLSYQAKFFGGISSSEEPLFWHAEHDQEKIALSISHCLHQIAIQSSAPEAEVDSVVTVYNGKYKNGRSLYEAFSVGEKSGQPKVIYVQDFDRERIPGSGALDAKFVDVQRVGWQPVIGIKGFEVSADQRVLRRTLQQNGSEGNLLDYKIEEVRIVFKQGLNPEQQYEFTKLFKEKLYQPGAIRYQVQSDQILELSSVRGERQADDVLPNVYQINPRDAAQGLPESHDRGLNWSYLLNFLRQN